MPKVSVIIPTYNRAHYICETIDSILAQTYRDYEIIVVDDGSADNTRKVLQKYDGKVRYFYQKNRGPSAARNFGISQSQGEYIAFLDDDDLWTENKLELQIDFFNNNPDCNFVFTDYLVLNHSGVMYTSGLLKKIIHKDIIGRKDGILESAFIKLVRQGFIMPSNVMIKKEIIEKFGLFDESLPCNEDRDWFLRITRNEKIGFINVPLQRRRKLSDGITSNPDKMCRWELEVFNKLPLKITNLNKLERANIQQRKSTIYYEWGYYYYESRQNGIARDKFLSSLYFHFSLKVFLYFLSCFLSSNILKHLRETKRKLYLYAKS